MPTSGNPSQAALKQLRYFRYNPVMGGFGGDWDTLEGSAPFATTGELSGILGELGYDGPPPIEEDRLTIGPLTVDGLPVHVTVVNRSTRPDRSGRVELLMAVYVTDAQVHEAMRVEAWLDSHSIRMDPRSDGA